MRKGLLHTQVLVRRGVGARRPLRAIRVILVLMGLLVSVAVMAVTPVSAATVGPELVSVDSADNPGTQNSGMSYWDIQVSDTGRYVLFVSTALNLDPNYQPTSDQVAYLRDRMARTTRLVSLGTDNLPVSGSVLRARMSGDGQHVVFAWAKSGGASETDVRDLVTGATTVVPGAGQDFSISDDGSRIAYSAPNQYTEEFLLDRPSNTVSTLPPGHSPIISGDGQHIIYDGSDAQVHEYNTVTETTTLVSAAPDGNPGNAQSIGAAASFDGRYVAFLSSATNFPGNGPTICAPNACWRIYRRDLTTGATQLADVTSAGADPSGPCSNTRAATLSSDGQRVAFASTCDLTTSPSGNGIPEVYVHDFTNGWTQMASVDSTGQAASWQADSALPELSGDGTTVAFSTIADMAGLGAALPTHGSPDGEMFPYLQVYAAAVTPPDTVPPVVTGSASPSPNGAGWNNTPVTVTWSASDNVDGVLPAPASTLLSTDGANQTATSAPVCDAAGNCATGSVTGINIDQTPPTVGTPAFSTNPVSDTGSTTVTAPASDALSGVVGGEMFLGADPGVGNGTPLTWDGTQMSGSLSGLATGIYTVSVRSVDAAGNWSPVSSALLVVYDPTGAFATGGGWIVPGGTTSDTGDTLPGMDGVSKANFGFTVKYQNGASTVPGGNLTFHYNVGHFDLQSSGMNWLVVTNSQWAHFQGSATINGGTDLYPFQVDARDGASTGQPDRFVVKIYPPGSDPSTATPVYKASGDVAGGQITIHTS